MEPQFEPRLTDPSSATSPSMPTQPARIQPMSTDGFRPGRLQPSFSNEIPMPQSKHGLYECLMNSIGAISGFFGSIPCIICCQNPYQTVQQGEVGLISRFGKYYKSVDPGLYQVNTWTEQLRRVDIRIQLADIPQQVIMTKDNVSVLLDSVLYWHIIDPYTATYMVENVKKALIERTQTTLRLVTGSRTLQECIEHRDALAQEIQAIIAAPASEWGVKVESLLIKDLQFSAELLESLSAAAKQKRIGESKVIAAQAEVDAAKLMREASDILNTPAAMQIRYLETLSQMSKNSGTKVIFMPAHASSMENDPNQVMKQIMLNEAGV